MRPINLHHLSAQIVQAATIIEIENIYDFHQFIEHHSTKEILVLNNPARFAIFSNQGILQILSKDFLTVDDYKKADSNGFKTSKDYYDAVDQNIKTFEEYDIIVQNGITDTTIIEKMQLQGYTNNFKDYKNYADKYPDKQQFKSPFEMYNFGIENEFDDFPQCFAGIMAGFDNGIVFKDAMDKGFHFASQYHEAIENGFNNADEYEKALEEGITNRHEWIQKKNLESINQNLPHDQALLLLLLSKLEQGKKASINKLKQLLENEIEEYLSVDNKPFEWFKTSLKTNEEYSKFLETNESVAKFGKYDPDGEFFELYQIQNRSIVIDGSNVAHNSKNGVPEKPSIENLQIMVKYLKSKGFTDIMIIADASLRHKLVDIKKLPQLQEQAKYEIAPAGKPADIYLIEYVKAKHCLLLSNDAFNQYKLTDPWVAVNINFYRLTFMITDGEVFMPDLK